MENKLKVCPFCGILPDDIKFTDSIYEVYCNYCKFKLTNKNYDNLVSLWNRRYGDRCANGCVIKKAVKEFYTFEE